MKRKLGLIATLFSGSLFSVQAQSSLGFEAGQVFSKFAFTNSDGDKQKEYNYTNTTAFSLHYQHTFKAGFFFRVGLGMRKAGAAQVVAETPISWNLNYATGFGGIGYQYDQYLLKPYVCVMPYYASLLKASQTIGTSVYDIKASNAIANADYGLYFVPGLSMSLSDDFALFAEYNQLLGLANIERNPEQKLVNRGFVFSLGVAATIGENKNKRIKNK